MSTPTIDYDALARQAGAVSSAAPGAVDYDTLAKQSGAISSTAPKATSSSPSPSVWQTFLDVAAPNADKYLAVGKALGSDLLGMVGGIPMGPPNPGAFINQAAQVGSDVAARKMEGRSNAYNAVATTGELVGINSRGMEQAANEGNTAGVVGHALAVPTAIAVGHGLTKLAPEASAAVSNRYYSDRTSAVRSTVPEAANLPPQAVHGAEQVYRAAAPTGGDPQFRSNLYAAAGDLAEVGQKVQLDSAAGGVMQPDMRVRATVNGINDHLQQMYDTERAPQIDRHAQNPVVTNFSSDAKAGLEYLAKNAGTEADRALAQNALQSEYIPLGQLDELARATNRELSPLRGMTSQELAVSEGNSRRFAALKALDAEAGNAIGTELDNRGEPGIQNYERRYAGLSQVRDQLQSRMNMTELQRRTPVVGSLVRTVMGGSRAAIAGASQAAVANVNIGAELANGLDNLARSGLTANRGTASPVSPVRGLLTPGAIELPESSQSFNPTSAPPPVDPLTRAQRFGLLLPEQAGGPHAMPPSGTLEPATYNLSPTNEWTKQAARNYAADPSKGAAYYLRRKK